MVVGGQTYLYGYDTTYALATVTFPGNQVKTYHFNESAHTGGSNLPYVLTGITDENGSRFATWKYNSSRKALSSEYAGGVSKYQFSYGGSSTTTTDPLGATLTSPFTTILGYKQVTGTTRTLGPAIIMTGMTCSPVSRRARSARNSV